MQIDEDKEMTDFTPEFDLYMRASIIWRKAGFSSTKEEVEDLCKLHCISYEDAMKWRDYWKEKCELHEEKQKMRITQL